MIPSGHHPAVTKMMEHLVSVWADKGPVTFHCWYKKPTEVTVHAYIHGRRADVRVVSLVEP